MKTVVVGLSGGVDSSVSALLLKEKGYHVIGMFMKNWDEGEECPAEKDYEDVVRIAEQLDIPFYTIDFTKEYWDSVFSTFLSDMEKGLTPNPDVLCNKEIKFKAFLQKAKELGADYLATGHYARTVDGKLLKGSDPNKDQSYFLYGVTKSALEQTLFPIGDLPKPQVREIAKKHGLITHNKKDSTGICFIGKRDFRPFVQKYLKKQPGLIETIDGKTVGEHEGVIFYTIGQRKGLGIGGPGDAYFVAGKDLKRNVLTVVQGEDHPALFTKEILATDVHWISSPPLLPLKCFAKVRYRSKEVPCHIEPIGEDLKVTFDNPERAVTPGQAIVFYLGDECLGGGLIRPHE